MISSDMNLIEVVEKIRYEIIGSSSHHCEIYVTPTNELIIKDDPILYRTVLTDILFPHGAICYISEKTTNKPDEVPYDIRQFNDISLMVQMEELYNQYIIKYSSLPLLAEDDDLFSNDSFVEASKIKSADGMVYYRITNHSTMLSYMVPYYVGLYKIKKADSYSCKIYKIDDLHLWINITDKKPKIQPIDMYIKTVNLFQLKG